MAEKHDDDRIPYEAEVARVRKVRDGYASQAKFADIDCAVHFREFVRRIEAALARQEPEGATL